MGDLLTASERNLLVRKQMAPAASCLDRSIAESEGNGMSANNAMFVEWCEQEGLPTSDLNWAIFKAGYNSGVVPISQRHRLINADPCNTSADPVRDLSAEAFTAWLIECHGLPESAQLTVVGNLREQFKWHRLQGRLDRHPVLSLLAELLALRWPVKTLEAKNS